MIREQAATAAQEWNERREHPLVAAAQVTYLEVAAYSEGYLAGHAAAKAEALVAYAATRLKPKKKIRWCENCGAIMCNIAPPKDGECPNWRELRSGR